MKLFSIPATVQKYVSKMNRSARLSFDTQENMSDDEIAKIAGAVDKYGWLVFFDESVHQDEVKQAIEELPDIKPDESLKKSKSQTLRAVIYVLWKQKGERGDFEVFYNSTMDKIINSLKEKLD